jgi:hypothetical protein
MLEGAVIVPASESKSLVEFMFNNSENIVSLNEDPGTSETSDPSAREDGGETDNSATRSKTKPDPIKNSRIVPLKDFLTNDLKISNSEAENKIKAINTLRGYTAAGDQTSAKYTRLTSPEVFLDTNNIRPSLDQTLGEILLNPKNAAIRDRFEKATFLLYSNRIAGVEWVEYLVKRLGIPVPRHVRRNVVSLYRIDQIIDPDNQNRRITRRDIRRIAENRTTTDRSILDVLSTDGRTFLTFLFTAGATTLAHAGITGGLAGLSGIGAGIALPVFAGLGGSLLLGAIVGVPVAIISGLIQSRIRKIQKRSKIEGWERVESLIIALEEQQSAVRKLNVVDEVPNEKASSIEKAVGFSDDNVLATSAEINNAMDEYKSSLSGIMKNARPKKQALVEFYIPELNLTEDEAKTMLENSKALFEAAFKGNKDHDTLALSEAIVSTKTPVELVATQSYEFDPKKGPEVLVVPKFTTRSQYAYGSTEYEKKDLKDRRYNAPLLMTIKFKERFDDGTFSDNELVAVIGILGVVTRVPSKEMEYILSSSAAGKTVKGILEPEGDPAQMISNFIGIEKVRKDVENLPISSDVWQNLEKVSRLAVANSLAGRKNDNIANAHIVFAQKEIDNVRADMNVDYMKDIKLVKSLLKRYSAFTVMIANDVSEKVYIFDNMENVNWDVVPYTALRNKDTGDTLNAVLNKMSSGRM